jgi:hypothetical protein
MLPPSNEFIFLIRVFFFPVTKCFQTMGTETGDCKTSDKRLFAENEDWEDPAKGLLSLRPQVSYPAFWMPQAQGTDL